MKVIEVFIKRQVYSTIVPALKSAGAKELKVKNVSSVSRVNNSSFMTEYFSKYFDGVYIEFMCEDEDSINFIGTIIKSLR